MTAPAVRDTGIHYTLQSEMKTLTDRKFGLKCCQKPYLVWAHMLIIFGNAISLMKIINNTCYTCFLILILNPVIKCNRIIITGLLNITGFLNIMGFLTILSSTLEKSPKLKSAKVWSLTILR